MNKLQLFARPSTPFMILTILVTTVFASTLGHDFVWDDDIFVTFRGAYQQLDFKAVLFSLQANGIEYLPVRDITYLLDFALWGKNSAGFHFSNLVWYWLTVIMVYLFLERLLGLFQADSEQKQQRSVRNSALVGAALFAVHPIHCEAVNFVTCRNVLVSGFFFFFSCQCYLGYLTGPDKRKTAYFIATLVGFVFTLFSKATGIVLPLVLLALACTILRTSRWQRFVHLVPFFIISSGSFFLFKELAVKTGVIVSEPVCNTLSCITEKIGLALQIPLFYLYKIVVPTGYSVDYDVSG